MAKSKKSSHVPASASPASTRPRWLWIAGSIGLVVVTLIALALLPDRLSTPRRKPPSTSEGFPTASNGSSKSGSSAANQASKVGSASANGSTSTPGHSTDEISVESLRKVLGRWKRSDAEYVLKLKAVDPTGKLEATYLNPADIHVAKAVAHSHGENAHLTIELRDVNYPGCIYDLTYDAKKDELAGTYFQAALGETYDVKFERSE